MKILFWCDAFWPLIGGVEVLGARLVSALRERGHEVCVIARRQPNHNTFDLFNDVPVHRLDFNEVRASRSIDHWVAVREQVANIKREFQPDVVHVYHVTMDVLFHMTTASAHPAPTVCTVHGLFDKYDLSRDSAVDRMLRTTDWLVTCSQATLEDTRKLLPGIAGRSSAILNGLDAPLLQPSPLPFDQSRLLCVGRIGTIDEKGFDVALRALSRLRHRFPGLRMVIAGDGAARRDLEQLSRELGVDDITDFLGFVHPDLIPQLINESTMLLVPSRVQEGFGLVALQGAQMARPVVASNVGGVPEVVVDGETGMLVESGNGDALACAISTLLIDRARAVAMGRAGRTRALSRFTLARYADEYEHLFERLAFAGSRELSIV